MTPLTQESIEQFLSSLSVHGRSPNTTRAYRADLTGWLEWTQTSAVPLSATTETSAATYLTEHRKTWAPKTTERKLGALRAWARWAGEINFLGQYKAPKAARPQPHPLPEGIDGIHRMLAAAGSPDMLAALAVVDQPGYLSACRRRALVALCGLCGLRVSEALAVAPADVDTATRMLHVTHGKGDVGRVVPISEAAFLAIAPALAQAQIDGTTLCNMGDRWARDVLTELGARAGLARRVSSHDLRATLLTAAFNKTKNIRVVQDLAGHSSVVTTQVYTGVAESQMRDAVDLDTPEPEDGVA